MTDGQGLGRSTHVELVVPVYNEEPNLASGVQRLCGWLGDHAAFSWTITIVDNGSVDKTAAVAQGLAEQYPQVAWRRLDAKGRGRALRAGWLASGADVVAYTDVDLSTELEVLVPMVEAIAAGQVDIAIGSRLVDGARVERGWKREILSRGYNLILRVAFAPTYHDAQCGLKAVRAEVAQKLVPMVKDDSWFFDTELLVLAEHYGYLIGEFAVTWTDDPDSRVRIVRTVREDLQGVARLWWTFGRFRGGRARDRERGRHGGAHG